MDDDDDDDGAAGALKTKAGGARSATAMLASALRSASRVQNTNTNCPHKTQASYQTGVRRGGLHNTVAGVV